MVVGGAAAEISPPLRWGVGEVLQNQVCESKSAIDLRRVRGYVHQSAVNCPGVWGGGGIFLSKRQNDRLVSP